MIPLSYILMAFNASELLDNPILYLASVFIALLGDGFFLIPVSVIAGALWIQKHDPVMISMFMITSGALLGGGSLFAGFESMAVFYTVFAGLGIGSLIISLYYGR